MRDSTHRIMIGLRFEFTKISSLIQKLFASLEKFPAPLYFMLILHIMASRMPRSAAAESL